MSTSQGEKKRQEMLEKQRTAMLAQYAEQRAALQADANRDHTSVERFVKHTEGIEDRMKKSTVGLVNAEDFKRIREELEEENRRKAAKTDDLKDDEKKRKKKKDKKSSKMLSFADEDGEGDGNGQTDAVAKEGEGRPIRFHLCWPAFLLISYPSQLVLQRKPSLARIQQSTHPFFQTASVRRRSARSEKNYGSSFYANKKRRNSKISISYAHTGTAQVIERSLR
jgi:hypothetical protein